MRIPLGNFGGIVAAPQQQAQAPVNNQVGQALAGVGAAVGGIAHTMQQAELQKQHGELVKKLETAEEAWLDAQAKLEDAQAEAA